MVGRLLSLGVWGGEGGGDGDGVGELGLLHWVW